MSMAISVTDTPTNPVTPARALTASPLNFGKDFRILSETGSEVILTNLTASTAAPEKIRVSFAEVADVFKGSGLTPTDSVAGTTVNTRGVSILIQATEVLQDLAQNGCAYPASAHLVLKLPIGVELTANDVQILLERLLGALFESGSGTTDDRINALVRGVVKPADL